MAAACFGNVSINREAPFLHRAQAIWSVPLMFYGVSSISTIHTTMN